MKGLVYIDGQILPAEEAKISVLDLSIMRGYGVFDFLRTYQKLPFRLWDHLKRFEASAKEIEIPLPLSMNEVVDFNVCFGIRSFFEQLLDHIYNFIN